MKLDLSPLENFVEMTKAAGNEVLYTAVMPNGEKKTIDVNMVFHCILKAIRALEHWTDSDLGSPKSAANNPTGQEAIGGR